MGRKQLLRNPRATDWCWLSFPSANLTLRGIYIKRESEHHIVLLDRFSVVTQGKAASSLKLNKLLKVSASSIALDNQAPDFMMKKRRKRSAADQLMTNMSLKHVQIFYKLR